MNAKRVKLLRRFLRVINNIDVRETKYLSRNEHIVVAKDNLDRVIASVPVHTVYLDENCGRAVYLQMKEAI